MKNIGFILLFVLSLCSCKNGNHVSTLTPEGEVNWLTFEQAQQIDNTEGKKFLVDVYTDWCGWCKVMDKKTFTNHEVKEYLNDNFYVIKFDAEQKEPLMFKGVEYKWKPGGRKGVNELAMEIMSGRLSYPTLVYMDENLNKIRSSPGYKKPDQLLNELRSL